MTPTETVAAIREAAEKAYVASQTETPLTADEEAIFNIFTLQAMPTTIAQICTEHDIMRKALEQIVQFEGQLTDDDRGRKNNFATAVLIARAALGMEEGT